MSEEDTLAVVAGELARGFQPLEQALASPNALQDFLRELGWNVNGVPQPVRDLAGAVQDVVASVEAGVSVESAPALAGKIARLIEEINQLATAPHAALPVPEPAAFAAEFPEQLAKHLIATHLIHHRPLLAGVLKVAGLLVDEEVEATGTRLTYRRRAFDWERLPDTLAQPFAATRARYDWGRRDIDLRLLLEDVQQIASGLGMPTRIAVLDDASFRYLSGGAADVDDRYRFLLRWHLFEALPPGGRATVAVSLTGTPPPPGGNAGIAILPFVASELDTELELSEELDVVFEAEAALSSGIAIQIHPDDPARIVSDIFPTDGGTTGVPPSTAAVTAGFEHRPETDEAVLLIGSRPGSRLEYDALSLVAGAQPGSGGRTSTFLEARLRGAAAVIEPSQNETDSFLKRLLPNEGLRIESDIEVGVDSVAGVYFKGSAGLEIRYPVHVSLGTAELTGLAIAVRPSPGTHALPMSIGADLKGAFGPVTTAVENVGFTATLDFGAADKNLGIADLKLSFKPPSGVALAIDIAEVSGGGFLRADPETGEYAGALELEFAEFLTLKAIGLISTRMPGGAPGFSLLIIVTAEFPGGLQLGYGFKLLAVGGLIGLERTMREQALLDGVRSGALELLMFPRDVVANAPRILSDLKTFFPPQAGHFLIAPMAKLAWGTPTLLTASVGVIIEIPGNVALIGVLKVVLPNEQAPVLRLQVNFAGVIDFDGQRAHLFAALFDSRVLTTPIAGEMGVLARWGDDPNLVLTVGGFHPAFTPPPLPFPTPRRVSLDILNRSNARLQVSGYFAVTSNTAQFGAHADLFFKFSAFQVEGDVGFDALFRFSPFAFQIDVSASVSLKAFGVGCFSISLRFALEGPTPWRAHGRGSVSLFFFDVSADFDLTWGEERETTLPPIDVLPLVAAELSKLEGWETRTPARKTLVSLRRLPATEDQLVLHPTGTLFVRQRAVPLDLTLDRIGSQRPRDVDRVSVDVAGGGLVKRADTGEMFAPAQFKDMDDAAKLSRPAFERQHGGLELSPDGTGLASARAVCRSARYEQIVFDAAFRRRARRFTPYATTLFNHLMAGNSVSRSLLSHARRTQTQPFAETIGLAGESFTVAHTRDNTAAAPAFASDAAARDLLARRLAEEPELAGALHVIPTAEVRG